MPVIEILKWTASEALLKDHGVLRPSIDQVCAVEGCQGVYFGIAEEDEKTVCLFLLWETYEHHQALMDDPVQNPSLINKLKPTFGPGEQAMNHINFNKDLTAALTAPCTEVVTLTLRDGRTKEDLAEVLTSLGTMIEAEKGSYPPVTWGQTLEDPNEFFLVIGWDSRKVHYDVVGQESFAQLLQNLRNTADLSLIHVNLAKHQAS